MAAATRVGSAFGNATNVVDMNIAAPNDTRLNVRTPARLLAARRSIPMTPPTTRATSKRVSIRTSEVRLGAGGNVGACNVLRVDVGGVVDVGASVEIDGVDVDVDVDGDGDGNDDDDGGDGLMDASSSSDGDDSRGHSEC